MLDDFFEGFSRSLGWFFGHVVGHLLFKAGYWVGWPFVKCITLGYYPGRHQRCSRRELLQEEVWSLIPECPFNERLMAHFRLG